jgi:hypothetical protein
MGDTATHLPTEDVHADDIQHPPSQSRTKDR